MEPPLCSLLVYFDPDMKRSLLGIRRLLSFHSLLALLRMPPVGVGAVPAELCGGQDMDGGPGHLDTTKHLTTHTSYYLRGA